MTGDYGRPTMGRLIGPCTILDTCRYIYGDNDPSNSHKAEAEISDHLPVFAEFNVH